MENRNQKSRRGSALVLAVFVMILAVGFSVASAFMVRTETVDIGFNERYTQALYVAEAGLERGVQNFNEIIAALTLQDPFAGIDAMNSTPFTDEPLVYGTTTIGEYTVEYYVLPYTGPGSATADTLDDSWREIQVTATGIVAQGTQGEVKRVLRQLTRIELSSSQVFDYAYFINHWGWWYGSNISSSGNIRANGQFDFGGRSPTVSGHPRWERLVYDPLTGKYDLQGYKDDNEDGLENGLDGGVYAGWNIVNDGSVKGKPNKYDWEDIVPMPNLSDLSIYENMAKKDGATIKIGGSTIVDAVLGDDAGEKKNLFLEGTAANPIVIDGTIVVHGSVVIKGVIRGTGVIYSGHNVYIADDVVYENLPPNSGTPAGTSEGQMEAFLNNPVTQAADGLGLFAREHVVLGDYTSGAWQSAVSGWVNHPLNESAEDAGIDGLPNTKAGEDGILGTDDDDVLEGDGIWSVLYYTQGHADAGQIPVGKNIGDPIPGTGEDIDGDGVYDGTTSMNEFYIDGNGSGSFDSSLWANMPVGVTNYNQIATSYIGNIHAAMYTNHTVAGKITSDAPNGNLLFLGALVSRNEAIVYSAKTFMMHHDLRLLGGGEAFGFFLPKTWNTHIITFAFQVVE
jgi:hypothetical protein